MSLERNFFSYIAGKLVIAYLVLNLLNDRKIALGSELVSFSDDPSH